METKHTPGPWEAVGNLVRSPVHQPEGLPTGVQVAECRDGYFLPHTEEAKANARLIAAAPDMLEALQAVLDRIKKSEWWWMACPDSGGFDAEAIGAAIAKATGSAA